MWPWEPEFQPFLWVIEHPEGFGFCILIAFLMAVIFYLSLIE